MSPADFLAKADVAARSAQVLLAAGDPDGACNRAYYAMFDAARAALLASGAPLETEFARTHGGVISAFGLHLVKTGLVDAAFGRSLNRAQRVRMIADYTGDLVDQDIAERQVAEATDFVRAMATTFGASSATTRTA